MSSEIYGNWGIGTDLAVNPSWIHIPPLNFPGCVVLGMLLPFSVFQFCVYRIDIIKVPTYSYCENSVTYDMPVHGTVPGTM